MRAFIVSLVIASLAMFPAAPADAAGCVSRSEYRKAKHNLTITRVHRIFGTSGKRLSYASYGGYAAQIRTYRGCGSRYNVVSVLFDKNPGGSWRLDTKAAVWIN
jgi:hypothetical protein